MEFSVQSPPNGDASSLPVERKPLPDVDCRDRLGRAREYQLEALAKPSALDSNLSLINGGLIEIVYQIEETIRRAMAAEPPTLERLQRVLPALGTYSRAVKQIGVFARLELSAAEASERLQRLAGEPAESAPASLPPSEEIAT